MRYDARIMGRIDIPRDQRVVLDHVHLTEQDYAGRTFVQFCTIGSRLEKCRFTGATINDAQFGSGIEMSELIDCVFDGATLTGLGGRSRFVRCSFRDVKGAHWIFNQAELIDCVFTGRLRTAIFSGAVPRDFRAELKRERNEFRGNDFSGTDLVDVTFRAGIDLTQQRLPSGPEYLYLPNGESAVARARSRAAA